jgi:ATP-dependent Clp protease ATP-binding subunit ClpA
MTMFERFTDEARAVVMAAVAEARAERTSHVGTQHLLLAILAQPASTSAVVLGRHGIDPDGVRTRLYALKSDAAGDDLDPDALRAIGIDLDAVRASVESSFGPGTLDVPAGSGKRRGGHVPFSPRSKKVLELSLREAIRLKQSSISDAHILLGIIREGEGLATQVLHQSGVDLTALRDDLEHDLRQAG